MALKCLDYKMTLNGEKNMNKLKELMKKFGEMKKAHKIAIIISAILLVVVLVTSIVLLVSCGGDSGSHKQPGQSSTDDSNAEKLTYTVSVKTAGGMAMSGLDIYVYADDKLTDLKDFKSTDENGLVNFNLAKNDKYAVVVSGAPKGYDVAASYSFTGNTAVITLTSAIVTGEDAPKKLGVGDVMYDMTVTTPTGTKYTLSEILKEKDMIMLNFWYTSCTYCVEEFPFINEAYDKYKDKVEILALNPLGEGNNAIQSFQNDMQLNFPMAECSTNWSSVFGITGYPTTIMIDRYGVICMIEPGGIPSVRPFISAFEHFTAENYTQKLCANGISDLVTQIKPTYTMDTSENIGAAINKGDINVTYRAEEGESGEFSWPFIIGEYGGEKVIYASNQQIDDAFAIIYADIELKAGQAIGFDYITSTELGNDALYVIVNGDDIYQMSGADEKPTWKSCYPCVASEDGTYELALVYMKDGSNNVGDDTVYIKNMRVVSEKDIDTETYLPREAATSKDGFEFEYVNIVYNEKDGYYHVGSVNGPLLLANLMDATLFSEEKTIHDLCYEGKILMEDGTSIYEHIVDYCSYATNTKFGTLCTVNKELAELLKIVAKQAGFEDDENEWLKMCVYYQAYGTNGKQLEDPIKGLSPESAYTATLGKNVKTNFFYYDRAIIPRGMFAAFTPSKSGVYRITSRTDTDSHLDGWIFNENKEELLVYEHDERMYEDDHNVSMVYYMEAGKTYYINIAFWDLYEVGYIYYDVEYVAPSIEHFRLCSPGYFTYDAGATGEDMYYVITGGIDVILKDGKYYEDLGKDANGNQKYGSLIYADFSGITAIFTQTPISPTMIDNGAFDFSKTENDMFVLNYLKKYDYDIEKTDAYLKEYWGENYDEYAKEYQLEDVYAGRYHGAGQDLTNEIKTYVSQMDKSNTARQGCVVVTERLAEILQMLMNKYTFENVENSWIKLCYYYDYIGAEK